MLRLAIAASVSYPALKESASAIDGSRDVLVCERFDDGMQTSRPWYDITSVGSLELQRGGVGCIECEWTKGSKRAGDTSAMRHLVQPMERI